MAAVVRSATERVVMVMVEVVVVVEEEVVAGAPVGSSPSRLENRRFRRHEWAVTAVTAAGVAEITDVAGVDDRAMNPAVTWGASLVRL